MTVTIAALQFLPVYMNPEANAVSLTRHLDAVQADIIVLPELCNTGYFFRNRDQAMALAEPGDGAFCSMIAGFSQKKNSVIVAGFDERDGDNLYNSAIIALPDGTQRIYRKTHLFAEEKTIFTPGNTGFFTVEHAGVSLGTMICYDWRFPESVRTLALKGAHIILHPSNLVAPPGMWGPVMQTRSLENRVFTVTSNRTGTETRGEDSLVFHGHSQITNVNGALLAQSDETAEGWITATIDPQKATEKSFSPWNDIFTDRRPEMYEL